MLSTERCMSCGRLIVAGRPLTPLKARIFEAIRRGGRDGIDVADLYDLLAGDRWRSKYILKAHVWQINQMLAGTGTRIGRFGNTYRVER